MHIDYREPRAAARQILEWIEQRIDREHVARVEQRHRKALRWEPLERAPLILSAPAQPPFAAYPYYEAFADPFKLLVNELVGPGLAWSDRSPSIVNSVLSKDDLPLQIRANYGVGLIASLFGAHIEVPENNMPWVQPYGRSRLASMIARGVPPLDAGLAARALDTMAIFREALAPYPRCREAIRVTQPDLQGPFDIASQLWGGEILTSFYDDPQFLRAALKVIGETYVALCRTFDAASNARLDDEFFYLHFSIFRGRCLLKDDSATMLSRRIYAEFIAPANAQVLTRLGGGGIHWCGSGDAWREELLSTLGLLAVDWGNPDMQDLTAWAEALRTRRLPVGRMSWQKDAFIEHAASRLFPSGATHVVSVADSSTSVEQLWSEAASQRA